MKKDTFIQSVKRVCVIVAVTAGMLILNIHSSSALTEEDTTLAEENLTAEEAAAVPEETPAEGTTIDASEPESTESSVPDSSESISDSTEADDIGTETPSENPDSSSSQDTDSGAESDVNTGTNPDSDIDSETNATDVPDSDINLDIDTDIDTENGSANENDTNSDADIENDSDTSTEIDSDASTGNDSDASTENDSDASTENDSTASSDIDSDQSASSSTESSTNEETQSKPNLSHQESVTVKPNKTVTDNNRDAVYVQQAYTPSGQFIANKDKIKYNVALPIDNIPSFITQEMIIAALKCQDETGFPASVTIAQIIQESGFGKYGPGGEDRQGLSYLAYQYCNLFGIKGTGTAGSVNMRTGEQAASGKYYSITAGFRVYNTYTECIEDRTSILKRMYSDLTKGVTDANTFAMKIGSRWATSHTYGQNLITQMERYDLYRLDEMTLQDFSQMIGVFANPCPGSYKTSSFGYRKFDNKFHKGIDFGTNGEEIPTYAVEAGTVVVAGYNSSAGNWIVIDHGNGLVTKYMHHSKIFVAKGQEVEKGQQIGLTGNTGRSSGVHLHFQVEENGVAVDPENYLYEDVVSETAENE